MSAMHTYQSPLPPPSIAEVAPLQRSCARFLTVAFEREGTLAVQGGLAILLCGTPQGGQSVAMAR